MTKKIIAIGNAIVDIVCKVDDEFLSKNGLEKASMSLIDENQAKEFSKLKAITITSGGSAANTVAAAAQIGADCGFIGKIANDDFGQKFKQSLENSGARFFYGDFSKNFSAQSFIFVTPDGQRTMCTHLGCASEIIANDIDENVIKSSSIIYLEGYLWYAKNALPALQKAINIAKENNVKIVLNLSDFNCVAFNKNEFLQLIKNDLDIVIANEAEVKELLGVRDIEENGFSDLLKFFDEKLIAVVTRSQKGCVVVHNGKISEIQTEEVANPIDTTGAGDAFAAGFLFGLLHGFSLVKSAEIGNLFAGEIIQKYGARFDNEEVQSIKLKIK